MIKSHELQQKKEVEIKGKQDIQVCCTWVQCGIRNYTLSRI